jgi:hypothetical protein
MYVVPGLSPIRVHLGMGLCLAKGISYLVSVKVVLVENEYKCTPIIRKVYRIYPSKCELCVPNQILHILNSLGDEWDYSAPMSSKSSRARCALSLNYHHVHQTRVPTRTSLLPLPKVNENNTEKKQ